MLVAVLMTSGVLVGTASPAGAYLTTCDKPSANYFQGYYYDPTAHTDEFEGASGYLTNRYGGVCDTDTSGPNPSSPGTNFSNWTSAWIMIADYNGSHYAQTGVIRGYNTPQYIFAEFTNASTGGPIDRYPSSPSLADGSRNPYYAVWASSCGCIQMKVASTVITQTNYNPFTVWYPGPNPSAPEWAPQFLAEKSYQANDTMGTSATPTVWDNIGAQLYSNDTLELMPCELSGMTSADPQTAARSARKANGCTGFSVWASS